MTPIGLVLRAAAERDPGALAIVDGTTRLTYAEWNARVNRAASALATLGLRRGDRAVVLMRNREETATVWAAFQKLGAVYAPMNFRLTPSEVETCATLLRPSLLVFEERTQDLAGAVLTGLGAGVRAIYVGDGPGPAGAFGFETLLAG
ncbi:MAG TPA: AMP-binding protein, partial [Solirubrobacteraceae bacterium]